jgi:hypothetical protein
MVYRYGLMAEGSRPQAVADRERADDALSGG